MDFRRFWWIFKEFGGFPWVPWAHAGPCRPCKQLGAWCRSSPTGGTNFQNPNFEISSFFAFWACLRRFGKLKKGHSPKSGMYPDFLSMYSKFLGMYPPYLGWSSCADRVPRSSRCPAYRGPGLSWCPMYRVPRLSRCPAYRVPRFSRCPAYRVP